MFGSTIARAMRFALWAQSLPKPPTTHQVQDYLHSSYLQATRWRNHWLRALPASPVPPLAATSTSQPANAQDNEP